MIAPLPQAVRRVWRTLPISVRRTVGQAILGAAMPTLAARLPRAAPDLPPAPPEPTVMGVFQAALGQGSAARLLMAELAQAGLAAQALDVTAEVGADRNDDRPRPGALADPRGPLILTLNPDSVLFALRRRGALLAERPVIGYFVWELETAPATWRRVRHALHAVWSPSRFSAAAVSQLFDMPAPVVPHPVALAPPPPPTPAARARGLALIGAQEGDFIALSSFSATSSLARKNPLAAIAAFEAAFGASPRHRLVLRCLGGHRFPGPLAALRAAVRASKSTIILIDAPGGVEELYDLYAACDVLLALHRSEGFGLNMAEAMLSGRAVIATAWSANLDFMDEHSAALVDYRLVPVRDPQGVYRVPGARWAEPDHDSAVAQLRRLANDAEARARLAAAGAALVRARLSGGAAIEALRPWIAPP